MIIFFLQLQQGILMESQQLLQAGLLSNTNGATRSIGYRQSMEFLQKLKTGEIELRPDTTRAFILEFEAATRKLVKQQITWFRSERRYQWVDVSSQTQDPVDLILKGWTKIRLPPCKYFGLTSGGIVWSIDQNKEQGVLNREEEKLLKRYQPVMHYYKDEEQISELMSQIQKLLEQ